MWYVTSVADCEVGDAAPWQSGKAIGRASGLLAQEQVDCLIKL